MSTLKLENIKHENSSTNNMVMNSNGSVSVTNNATVGGTLGITGATTASGTLTSTGLITASSGVAIGGTGAANTLDDYEEGTFTPFLSALNQNPTYTEQTGRYTKVGRHCNVYMRLATSSFNNGTGNIKFGGLPFTSVSGPYYIAQIFSLFGFEDYAGDIIAQFNTGTTNCELYSQAEWAGSNYITVNNTHLHGNGTGQAFMLTICGGYEVQ
tara:strand:+ start:1026 stop:1661 length:636 start_codon:yes stop_codon:yes gene_type:complete